MPWDDNKDTGDELTSDEWDNHVSEHRDIYDPDADEVTADVNNDSVTTEEGFTETVPDDPTAIPNRSHVEVWTPVESLNVSQGTLDETINLPDFVGKGVDGDYSEVRISGMVLNNEDVGMVDFSVYTDGITTAGDYNFTLETDSGFSQTSNDRFTICPMDSSFNGLRFGYRISVPRRRAVIYGRAASRRSDDTLSRGGYNGGGETALDTLSFSSSDVISEAYLVVEARGLF